MNAPLSADGTALATYVDGDGPPVVFAHGTAADGERWRPLAKFLPGRRCIGYDRRGRGGSGDAGPYVFEREVEDLLAVIAWAGGAADVAAHSFSGLVALEAARRAPDRVRRLALYEAPLAAPGGPDFVELDKVAALERVLAEQGREAAVIHFQRNFPRATEAEIEAMRRMPIWAGRIGAAHTIPRELRAVAARRADAADFALWRVPTLILLGGDSPPPFQASAQWLAATIPGAVLDVLPGERHRAMDTVPEAVARRLAQFWARPVAFEQADGAAAARAMLDFIQAAVRARDVESVRPLIAEDGVYYGSFEPVMRGFSEMREKQFSKVWPNIANFAIPPESIRTGGSGDCAWAQNLFRTKAKDAAGAEFVREGRMTWVMERRQGRWVIVHSHDSLFPARQLKGGS
jgi:pimeloyl-ACP methyl ester carboxylesterase/ketosteroid isomerase-like protein